MLTSLQAPLQSSHLTTHGRDRTIINNILCNRNGAGLHFGKTRGPLDDKYILGLLLQQRKHLLLAGMPPAQSASATWIIPKSSLRAYSCCAAYQQATVGAPLRCLGRRGFRLPVRREWCAACSLASPILSGVLVEILKRRQPILALALLCFLLCSACSLTMSHAMMQVSRWWCAAHATWLRPS